MNILFVIIAFVLIILINLYFRIKVIKHYKYLINNRIEFNLGDIFNSKNLEKVIQDQNADHRYHISSFAKYLKIGVYLTCAVVVLIAILFVWMKI